MEGRFALFAGSAYYPRGGWDDFVGFGTADECKAMFVSWRRGSDADWAHIVDLAAGKIVLWAGGNERREWVWLDRDPEA